MTFQGDDTDKQSIYDLFEKCGFWHVITEHEPVCNTEEAGRLELLRERETEVEITDF